MKQDYIEAAKQLTNLADDLQNEKVREILKNGAEKILNKVRTPILAQVEVEDAKDSAA